ELIDDLNPTLEDDASKETHEENPRYLSHILEQNYLKRNEDDSVSLAGVSIGIALKSVYQFHTEKAGPYFHDISQKEMVAEGKEIAEQIVKEIREVEGLNNVPIMIALYKEEEQSSPVPGNYVTKTTVSKGNTTIDKWEDISEKHVLFPSSTGKEKHYEDYQKVKNFGDEISDYFPNYVGVIGDGFYVNQELTKLTLEIP